MIMVEPCVPKLSVKPYRADTVGFPSSKHNDDLEFYKVPSFIPLVGGNGM
jgi:hypothetical protein